MSTQTKSKEVVHHPISEHTAMPLPAQPFIPVAILVRVSTSRQDVARQLEELQGVAASRGWSVIQIIEEVITGSADLEDREGLQRCLKLARSGDIKKVLVHEVSRISRRPAVAMVFVEELEKLGVSLYWASQALETLLVSGKRNPAAGIMLAVLSEFARAEKEQLVERIKSGLAEARRKGVKLGRPYGSGFLDTEDRLGKHRDIVRLLRAGRSIRETAKISGKGANTVLRVSRAMKKAGVTVVG